MIVRRIIRLWIGHFFLQNVELVRPLPAIGEDELGDRVQITTDATNTAAGSGLHVATCWCLGNHERNSESLVKPMPSCKSQSIRAKNPRNPSTQPKPETLRRLSTTRAHNSSRRLCGDSTQPMHSGRAEESCIMVETQDGDIINQRKAHTPAP